MKPALRDAIEKLEKYHRELFELTDAEQDSTLDSIVDLLRSLDTSRGQSWVPKLTGCPLGKDCPCIACYWPDCLVCRAYVHPSLGKCLAKSFATTEEVLASILDEMVNWDIYSPEAKHVHDRAMHLILSMLGIAAIRRQKKDCWFIHDEKYPHDRIPEAGKHKNPDDATGVTKRSELD